MGSNPGPLSPLTGKEQTRDVNKPMKMSELHYSLNLCRKYFLFDLVQAIKVGFLNSAVGAVSFDNFVKLCVFIVPLLPFPAT